jgi:hypothetical protein
MGRSSRKPWCDQSAEIDRPIYRVILELISKYCGGPAAINGSHWFGIHLPVINVDFVGSGRQRGHNREDVIAGETN